MRDIVRNPLLLIVKCSRTPIFRWIPDKKYLELYYKAIFKKTLELKHPKTFNEKLQWMKLYDRDELYTKLADKYLVREYVREKIGEEYLVPLLGVYDKYKDIDFKKLPNQFVIKCNHDSGGVVICRNKEEFDYVKARKKINRSLSRNYYYHGREWAYKNIRKRIIAEKYIEDSQGGDLRDYKIMCFNGVAKMSFVCSNRETAEGLCVNFYDLNWNEMPFERHYPRNKEKIKKPRNYEKMLFLAEKLSVGLKFARIDFYEVDDKIYFGEITLYPGNGFEEFSPDEYDTYIGEWLDISK